MVRARKWDGLGARTDGTELKQKCQKKTSKREKDNEASPLKIEAKPSQTSNESQSESMNGNVKRIKTRDKSKQRFEGRERGELFELFD